jgi:hypothetical protein
MKSRAIYYTFFKGKLKKKRKFFNFKYQPQILPFGDVAMLRSGDLLAPTGAYAPTGWRLCSGALICEVDLKSSDPVKPLLVLCLGNTLYKSPSPNLSREGIRIG